MPIRCLSVLLLLLASTVVLGEPAAWYWWASKLDAGRICRQTSPGPGWVQEAVAFRDARCRIRLELP